MAIATRRIEAGTRVVYEGSSSRYRTPFSGHRFAVESVAEGEDLLSWGLPFGKALKTGLGEYACNEKILRVLRDRHGTLLRLDEDEDLKEPTTRAGAGSGGYRKEDLALPDEPTSATLSSSPTSWNRGPFGPAPRCYHDEPRTFTGYRRGAGRG